MTQLKIGGHVSVSGGIGKAVHRTLDISGNCMQIFSSAPQRWTRVKYSNAELETFKKEARAANVSPVFVHAAYLPNVCSPDKETVEKSIDCLARDLRFTHAIGGGGLIFHLGSHMGLGFESVKDQVVFAIERIYEAAGTDSGLILENSSGKRNIVGSRFEELVYIINKSGYKLSICLDTAHMFAAGHDIVSLEGAKKLRGELDSMGIYERLVCWHVNDSKVPFANGNDRHENIGEGYIGIKGFEKFFSIFDPSRAPLILEVPGFEGSGPDEKNIRILRNLILNLA